MNICIYRGFPLINTFALFTVWYSYCVNPRNKYIHIIASGFTSYYLIELYMMIP